MSSLRFLCEKITSKHILSVETFGDEDRFCLKLLKRYTSRRTVRFGCRFKNYDKMMKNVENYRSKGVVYNKGLLAIYATEFRLLRIYTRYFVNERNELRVVYVNIKEKETL